MPSVDLWGEEHPDRAAIGSHQTNGDGGSDEWLTPPGLLRALGPFDLDPCAPRSWPSPEWPRASRWYTIEDNGLREELPWTGRVFLNPPYSKASRWLARLAQHGEGVALLFARTETQMWFQHVWPHTTGILFLEGRLTFCYANGRAASANSGAPSALIAYGDRDAAILARCPLPGVFVTTGRRR